MLAPWDGAVPALPFLLAMSSSLSESLEEESVSLLLLWDEALLEEELESVFGVVVSGLGGMLPEDDDGEEGAASD